MRVTRSFESEKPYPRPFLFLCGTAVHLIETIENKGEFFLGDSRARIGDLDFKSGRGIGGAEGNHRTVIAEFKGIAQEVIDDILQFVPGQRRPKARYAECGPCNLCCAGPHGS